MAVPSHLVLAGVNKAGTTSLFVALSAHRDICPSAVKETRYFLPPRYGRPVGPRAVYDAQFDAALPGQVRMEATPSYFYGGADVGRAVVDTLPDPRVLVILREPVARAVSFFRYQKARLRFPEDLTIEEYLTHADALSESDFQTPDNERYMAVRGGRYADFLPGWLDAVGPGALRIESFEGLLADPAGVLAGIVEWLGLPADASLAGSLASENRTTGYRRAWMQRVALAGNDRFERFLRRHGGLKRTARAWYYRLNGKKPSDVVSDAVRADLERRFVEPNRRLARQLLAAGHPLPPWLDAPGPELRSPPRDQDRASPR